MDLVDYLEKLGYRAQKIRNNDYWYLSPLREEKTPSFKVNRRMNVWYDHALGKGGTLVDFGKLYHRCSVKELLAKLEEEKDILVSFHPHRHSPADEKKETSQKAGKIQVISSADISDPALLQYLHAREIPLAIANQFCHEVTFELYGKKHRAIGSKNDKGGYELRNSYFKGSSAPKEPCLIKGKDEKELSVFEGFFNFLSFQTLQQSARKNPVELPTIQADSLVLNSLSFFERSRPLMEQYVKIHLFLDCDDMGVKATQQALRWSDKYQDHSRYYHRFKDLNDYLINSATHELGQSVRKGMNF